MIKSFNIDCEIIEVASYKNVFEMVASKDADAGVVNSVFGPANHKRYNIRLSPVLFNPFDLLFAVPEGKNSELLKTIDTYFEDWKQDGNSYYYKTLHRWFGESELPKSKLPVWVLYLIGGACFVVFFLFIWTRTLKRKVIKRTYDLQDAVSKLKAEITERKQAEKALRAAEQLFSYYMDSIDSYVYIKDREGNYTFINKKTEKLFNTTREDLKKKKYTDFDFFDEEMAKQLRKNDKKIIDTGQNTENEEIGRPEGRENIERGVGFKYFLALKFPLRDKDGNIIGVCGFSHDITDKKKAEKERDVLESRLQQSQKMESIGTLAGGIAHDFNNLLYPIIGFSEMLKEDLTPDSPEHESAQEIYNAGRRGGELVKQILAFSRQTEHKLSPVHFQKILTEVCKLIRSTIPSDIEIFQDIQKDCGLVMAEATQLHQIAMNLITNAYHAVEKASGEIAIQLKEIILDNDDLKDSPLQPGQYVMLSVSDNGVGIPKEIMNNIFEPYFTTKEKGKGTGLGLAVVYGILTEHKGDIKVYSEKGLGTTFNVYLPLMKKSDEAISTEKELNKLTGTERILLVDDEKSVVRLEKLMLERLGYNVSAMSNSLEALEIFNSNPDGYDLVISDMTMPNMTGDQLAQELMAIRPDIPIVICTGFSERINKEQAEANKVKGFLMKPVIKSEMAQMVREVLDEAKIFP